MLCLFPVTNLTRTQPPQSVNPIPSNRHSRSKSTTQAAATLFERDQQSIDLTQVFVAIDTYSPFQAPSQKSCGSRIDQFAQLLIRDRSRRGIGLTFIWSPDLSYDYIFKQTTKLMISL